jgi:hypothetical protein
LRSQGFAGTSAEDVHSRLTTTMWAKEQDGNLDLHCLPRRLLLRRLAGDPAWWRDVHEGFQAYYAQRDETLWWYHKLACAEPGQAGELGQLAKHMNEVLDHRSPDEWLKVLEKVTAAPNMLRTRDDPRDVVARLAGPAPRDRAGRLRTVARIVVAQWLHGDRLFDPRHSLARLLNAEYWDLADHLERNGAVFSQKAVEFGKIARKWGWIQ